MWIRVWGCVVVLFLSGDGLGWDGMGFAFPFDTRVVMERWRGAVL